jgi:hypothetical protein
MEYGTDQDLGELAQRALDAQDRERRRQFSFWLRILLLLGVPAVAVVAWLALVGYQRHVIEIETGGRIFRIVSHKSPFEVYTANDEFAPPKPGGFSTTISEDFESDRVQARMYDWAPIVTTRQRVKLPDGMINYVFYVNLIPFSLTRSEIQSGEQRWQAQPGEVREIVVDRLSPPQAVPIRVPVMLDE